MNHMTKVKTGAATVLTYWANSLRCTTRCSCAAVSDGGRASMESFWNPGTVNQVVIAVPRPMTRNAPSQDGFSRSAWKVREGDQMIQMRRCRQCTAFIDATFKERR